MKTSITRPGGAALRRARRVLLTKDYVRLCLTGEVASDRADSSATLLMDTVRGDWHDGILEACGLDRTLLPPLVDSAEIAGNLRADLAGRWHLPPGTPVVGGGGDNMCAGVGIGAVEAGAAYVSLGTSGVYFVANDTFRPAHGGGMHTHRHAVPRLYAQHAVVLSAAAALTWVAELVRAPDVTTLVAEVEAAGVRIELTQPGMAAYIPRNGAPPVGPFFISNRGLGKLQDELAPEVARANDGDGLLGALVPAAIGAVALGVLLSGDGDDDDRPRTNQGSSNTTRGNNSTSDNSRDPPSNPNRPR